MDTARLSQEGTNKTDLPREQKQTTFRYENLPIDRGWAYVIMFGIALWNFFIAATLKSFGILYVEFLDLYGERPSVTGWIGGTFGAVTTIIAPLAGYIADRYPVKKTRILVMCCGVVASFGIAISSVMPTLWATILTYGVIAGTAAGLMDTPILSLVAIYFRKKRSLASGVAFAGSSIGTCVLPPILALCIEAYTVRGALIIFGGLWLHTAILGALMRPIPSPDQLEILQEIDCEQNTAQESTCLSTGDQTSIDNPSSSTTSPSGDVGTTDKAEHETLNTGSKVNMLDKKQLIRDAKTAQNGIFRDYVHFCSTPKLPFSMLTFIFASFGYYNQFFIFPPLAHELGLSRLVGSALVALPNILEIFTRIATGFLADRFVHKKHIMVLCNCISMAGCTVLISFFTTKVTLMIYAAIFGLFGGIFVPLILPMLYDLVKPSQIGRASGLFPLLTGLGISFGPPLLGAVREVSGTYTTCLQVCAVSYLLAAICLFFTMDRKVLKCRNYAPTTTDSPPNEAV